VTRIYHLCPRADWDAALALCRYEGSDAARADGFLHFSTAAQVRESARRHLAGIADLVMLTVAADGLPLKWEPAQSRGEDFPHLYGALPLAAVLRVDDVPLVDGGHVFPDWLETPDSGA